MDFILVWETIPGELSRQQDTRKNGDLQERSATIHRTWWKKFLDNLHAAGIHIAKVPGDPTSVSPCGIAQSHLQLVLQSLGVPNLLAREVPSQLLDNCTCPSKATKLSTLRDPGHNPVRLLQVEVGVDQLLSQNISTAAFPLHQAPYITSITSSVVNLILILILSKICISLAHFLTKLAKVLPAGQVPGGMAEMHHAQTKSENAFSFKVFFFQFVTCYSLPIYTAFFKGREREGFGVLLGGREVVLASCSGGHGPSHLPRELKCWGQKHKLLSTKKVGEEGKSGLVEQAPWVMDHQLLVFKGLFDEYLEMVPWFGSITIFVAACPLAPLFALLSSWVKICLDAHKFLCDQWPVAEWAQGFGWFSILEAITQLAASSSAFLRAFTPDLLPWEYCECVHGSSLHGCVTFTLAYVPWDFVLQISNTCTRSPRPTTHVDFFIGHVVAWLVPDIPESMEIKHEWYLAKEALAENKVG
ncbi:LOW QUALITY PROTEIN: anoctamin-7 [Aegotheles albertisi]